ncbi:uncharacterized protein LOC110113802 [Dendrobium catenatum]|uniref:uncharacterized protein LOC110113802 n=1 Tax=Dendrobium catenatum TaxID=906689 RepID=UPI0009F3517E|nr:uncharacterized protein LOC110113802 [Dendrobium catenatum]
MAFGVFSPFLFKPFIPSPSVARRAPCLPLHRNTSQTNSITATRAGDPMKLLCTINALFLKHVGKCNTPFHIWLSLISEMDDRVIYGYWMSPDLEDGWGFVVAAVDQLYSV